MKKYYLIAFMFGLALITAIPVKGQTTIDVAMASNEHSALSAALHSQEGNDLSGITDLTVTGTINAIDFRFLRDSLNQLTKLDLSACAIAAYSGSLGTADYYGRLNQNVSFPADAIPHYAFLLSNTGFKNLSTLFLPTSTKTIMGRGLYGLPSTLAILNLSDLASLESIGDMAFWNCKFQKIIFPETEAFKYMGGQVFNMCTEIDTIIIPKSVDSLSCGMGNFVIGCGKLEALTFEEPSSVKALPFEFFTDAATEPKLDLLTYFKLPKSIVNLGYGDNALINTYFTYIDCDSENPIYESINGILYRKDNGAIVASPKGLTTYHIPATMTVIPASFFESSKLSSLTFEDATTLEEIGERAFYNCPLASFDFAACTALEKIGNSAFEGSQLSSITFNSPAALVEIGDRAFYGLAITGFDFNACPSLERIGDNAFDATKLTSVNFSNNSDISMGNYVFNNTKDLTVANLSGISRMSLYGMFTGSNVKTVDFGTKITRIPTEAFAYCDSLTSINLLSSSIDTIDGYVFNSCGNLSSITLPENIKYMGRGAVANTAISILQIPASLMLDGNNGYALGTIKVEVDAENPLYSSQDGMLLNKNGNILLHAPASTDSAYKHLIVPEGVDSVFANAFTGNTNRFISKATLPSTLKYVHNTTGLGGLSNVATIICNAVNPPECPDAGWGTNALGNQSGYGRVQNVYVPANTLKEYIVAAGWRYYHSGSHYSPDTTASRYYDRDSETGKIIPGTGHELGDAPQNFTAEADAAGKMVNLSWEVPESFGHDYTYEILRNNIVLDSVDADVFTYIDENAPQGTQYYQINALYKYKEVDYNGKTDSVEVVVNFSVGNSMLNENSQVVVFPNPTSDVVTISTSCKMVRVYDMRGALLASIKGSRVDMRSFPTGTYVFEITTAEGHVSTTKVTKK
jgi:hypothetical protein